VGPNNKSSSFRLGIDDDQLENYNIIIKLIKLNFQVCRLTCESALPRAWTEGPSSPS
jgi:hypothetical protein